MNLFKNATRGATHVQPEPQKNKSSPTPPRHIIASCPSLNSGKIEQNQYT